MLTCIACSKQLADDEPGGGGGGEVSRGTPSNKEAVKSLTSQIKDIALKFSGAYRQCKPGSNTYKKGERPYRDFDTVSEGVHYPYLRGGSSSSTPACDFPSLYRDHSSLPDSRFKDADRAGGGLEGISSRSNDVVIQEDEEPKEWMAQVEPGVHITFVSLPQGGNDLKRIRFSREIFNKWQAQRWWGENYDRIMELYNVQRFSRQALHTPSRSEDERDSSFSRTISARESPVTPPLSKEWTAKNHYRPPLPCGTKNGYYSSDIMEHQGAGPSGQGTSIDASRTTTSSRDEASISISNASDQDSEWVEQDEVGVYITIRQLSDGTRELRRVRFSRERFGEVHAKLWWEENRERIQAQYL